MQQLYDFDQNGHLVSLSTNPNIIDFPKKPSANLPIDWRVIVDPKSIIQDSTRDQLLTDFGKETYKKMVQNLVWATAYNSFAIPLAAGVLYNAGFVLGPAVGAIFMSLSTIVVAVNAQLLKTKLNKS